MRVIIADGGMGDVTMAEGLAGAAANRAHGLGIDIALLAARGLDARRPGMPAESCAA